MSRPLTPPSKPYTIREMLARVEKHFFDEGNPRCGGDDFFCYYGLTGCAVGCLMTQEHGDQLDKNGDQPISEVYDYCRDIYNQYFTSAHMPFLSELQSWHDNMKTTLSREDFEEIKRRWGKVEY